MAVVISNKQTPCRSGAVGLFCVGSEKGPSNWSETCCPWSSRFPNNTFAVCPPVSCAALWLFGSHRLIYSLIPITARSWICLCKDLQEALSGNVDWMDGLELSAWCWAIGLTENRNHTHIDDSFLNCCDAVGKVIQFYLIWREIIYVAVAVFRHSNQMQEVILEKADTSEQPGKNPKI